MIRVFPDPYLDELLYSVRARYKTLMDYPNSVTATRGFFGVGVAAAVVDLPNRLDHLVAALPPEHLILHWEGSHCSFDTKIAGLLSR